MLTTAFKQIENSQRCKVIDKLYKSRSDKKVKNTYQQIKQIENSQRCKVIDKLYKSRSDRKVKVT